MSPSVFSIKMRVIRVDYSCEADRQILEFLKYGLGITMREAHDMASMIILSGLDPIEAEGEEFIFSGPGDVPEPFANVDLAEAREATARDGRECERILKVDGSVEAAMRVLRTSIAWAAFWSVRAPDPKLRGAFERTLERSEGGMERMREKAFRKVNLEVINADREN